MWTASESKLSGGTGVSLLEGRGRMHCGGDTIYKGQGMRDMQGSPERAAKVCGRREEETESRDCVRRKLFSGT